MGRRNQTEAIPTHSPSATIPGLCLFTLILSLGLSLSPGLVMASTPCGPHKASWAQPASVFTRSLLLSMASTTKTIVVAGERGQVFLSTPEGADWAQAKIPSQSTLTGVASTQEEQFWIVGHDTVILHSPDSGKTWTCQFFAPEWETPLFDVWFQNSRHGIAVGAYGLALQTHDGGKRWDRLALSESDPHLYAITGDLKGRMYIAGESGVIFTSTDFGKTWRSLPSPYSGTLFGVLWTSDESLFVFGLRGHLFRSQDYGSTWVKHRTGSSASLLRGIEQSNGQIVIIGMGGTILTGTNDRQRFQVTHHTKRQDFVDIMELNSGQLLLIGEAGLTRLPNVPAVPQ